MRLWDDAPAPPSPSLIRATDEWAQVCGTNRPVLLRATLHQCSEDGSHAALGAVAGRELAKSADMSTQDLLDHGKCLVRLRRFKEGETCFAAAVQAGPEGSYTQADALRRLAHLRQTMLDDRPGATEALRKLADTSPRRHSLRDARQFLGHHWSQPKKAQEETGK